MIVEFKKNVMIVRKKKQSLIFETLTLTVISDAKGATLFTGCLSIDFYYYIIFLIRGIFHFPCIYILSL